MKWDPSHSNENIKLEDATAMHARNVWDTVQCDTWLSSGVHRITVKTDDVENVGLFLGVVSRDFWSDDAEDEPMRDSPHALCMHGDGRVVCCARNSARQSPHRAVLTDCRLLLPVSVY